MWAIESVGSYGGISGYYSFYQSQLNQRANANANPAGTQPVEAVNRAQTTPVPPVAKTAAVQRGSAQGAEDLLPRGVELPALREGADPVEMAVRGRIRDMEDDRPLSFDQPLNAKGEAVDPEEEPKTPQETMEEAECQTCKNRKYQDGSDDPGVSFKTATNVAPEQAAAAVRGHEQEHVVREQAKAQREDRRVVSQSVTIHTAICPECGDVYVSGGTTRTSTKANPTEEQPQQQDSDESRKSGFQAFA